MRSQASVLSSHVTHMKQLHLIGAFFLAAACAATGQEWTRFRGPNGTGISHATTIPTVWSGSDINWKTALRGVGHSSPVVWGDKVFVTSCDEQAEEFLVICVSSENGEILWQKAYGQSPHEKHRFNSFASATPSVDAERVYVCRTEAARVVLCALDHDGAQIWERDLGPFEGNHGSGTSPIVHKELVILANEQRGDSFLIAVDSRTGETRWQVPRSSDRGNYSTPCLYSPKQSAPVLIFNSDVHGISALDPDTGRKVWELAGVFSQRSVSSPVIAGDLIFGSCGSGGGGNYVVAVRPGDPLGGRQPGRAYEIRRSAPYVPTGVCAGDWLYLWSDGGIVSRVRAATGEVDWQERVGGNFFGSPVCVDGRLFCISTEGEVVVVGSSERFEVLARNQLNESTHSTPAIAGGRMYIHTGQHLLSVGGEGRPEKSSDSDT